MAAFMIRTKANANDVSRRFYVKGEQRMGFNKQMLEE